MCVRCKNSTPLGVCRREAEKIEGIRFFASLLFGTLSKFIKANRSIEQSKLLRWHLQFMLYQRKIIISPSVQAIDTRKKLLKDQLKAYMHLSLNKKGINLLVKRCNQSEYFLPGQSAITRNKKQYSQSWENKNKIKSCRFWIWDFYDAVVSQYKIYCYYLLYINDGQCNP